MTPEQILAARPLVLDQRERYFEDGFLTVPGYIGAAWLGRLRAVVAAKIEESRTLSASDDQFDLAPDHSAEKPNIRRLRKAVDQHPELWTFAKDPAVVDLCADLLGPDVRFHSSKLNFKWSEGGDAVHWHQDIQAWPHTNCAVLTFGVYVEGHRARAGPAHGDSRHASRRHLRAVRHAGELDRRRRRARRGHPAHRRRP
jgi:ectoine hydroxylase